MTDKKNSEINKLITSREFVINERFLTNLSMMDTGASPKTYCIIVMDLVEAHFKIQYFLIKFFI